MSGEPLYRACGYHEIERIVNHTPHGDVPSLRMTKPLPAMNTPTT